MSKAYDKALQKFKVAFNEFIDRLESKINSLTIKRETFNSASLTLKNNTIHIYDGNGLSNLQIIYPSGEFISSIIFSTSKSGTINITWPTDTVFVGSEMPEFFPAETWEINVHNKRVACAQLYTR